MGKLVRESIGFERGGDPRKTMKVGKLERLKEKYDAKYLDELLNVVVKDGNLEDVKFIIEHGFDIHKMHDFTLQAATEYGHLDIVKYLIKQRIKAGIDRDIDWLLWWAASAGHLDIVKYLVEQGADISAENYLAFRWAVDSGNLDVVKYLVEQGADIHASHDYALREAKTFNHQDVVQRLDVVNYLKSLMNDE